MRGFAKITRDVTERREAEEELRQSTEIFQLLVSSVRDYAIFMLDPEGNIATWNSGAQQIKGYEPRGDHRPALLDVLHRRRPPRPASRSASSRSRAKQGSVEDEGWRVRKDGTRFWANVVITAVYDAHGKLRGFAKVTRDITDRKEAEETQRALLEQREARLQAEEERRRAEASYRVAQEANRAKDEFLMTLSHELRTPMTAILGWSRMLPAMSPDDPLFREAIDSIAGGAQLQARLIDDILDVSRIVSGKLRLTPETVEVARVIMNAVDAVARPRRRSRSRSPPRSRRPSASMVADATRIQQVIWNLLANAVKFTPRHGAVQRLGAAHRLARADLRHATPAKGSIRSSCRTSSSRSARPSRRRRACTAVSGSACRSSATSPRRTAERSAAESEGRGKGATFTVTLPVRAVSAGTAPVRNPLGDTFLHRDRLRGLDIVLVDDEPESRKMVTAVLRAAGANVLPLDSAGAALDAIDQRRPHLVITDIAMPEMDGYTFTRTLRARDYGPELKVVALSAFPARHDEESGFDAYLTKPIDPFHLVDEVARITLRATA